ncbi:hypothetical protein HK098_005294 [Nowakowskiella sp. JEL0407]|nr:hypothetical protein HK098_005294 [Nowakowskiella sp. JEL0407]
MPANVLSRSAFSDTNTQEAQPGTSNIGLATITLALGIISTIICAFKYRRSRRNKEQNTPLSQPPIESSTALSPTKRRELIGPRPRSMDCSAQKSFLQIYPQEDHTSIRRQCQERAIQIKTEFIPIYTNCIDTNKPETGSLSNSSLYSHSNPGSKKKANTSTNSSPTNQFNGFNLYRNEYEYEPSSCPDLSPNGPYTSTFSRDYAYTDLNQIMYGEYPSTNDYRNNSPTMTLKTATIAKNQAATPNTAIPQAENTRRERESENSKSAIDKLLEIMAELEYYMSN